MVEVNFKDRVPTYPGRITLLPVDGSENTFDMTRADEPTEEGTPIVKATLDSITQSRLTGRFYEMTVTSTQNTAYNTPVYNNAFEVESGVPLEWTLGQRITVLAPEIDSTITVAENTFNGVKVNTILQSGKRYELIYNGKSFDVKEL